MVQRLITVRDILRGPRNKVVHCFICSHPFFAASRTGLVRAGTSVSMAEGVDGSVLLVCDVVFLAVSDAVISSGYKRAIG